MSYQNARNVRREARTLVGRFRGGKLNPVLATAVRGNEGGLLSQSITMELDPIAGRMITPISGELIAVFVPVQAIDYIVDPEASYAGMTEVVREKLLSGSPLFGLEEEGEISQRCGVNPRSIAGVKKVNECVRLAHNAAVNFLRQRKYDKAVLVDADNEDVTPAIISQTVLQRLNGVLDPDDRINGSIDLEFSASQIPVIGVSQNTNFTGGASAGMTSDANAIYINGGSGKEVHFKRKDGNPAGTELDIYGDLDAISVGGLSLADLYNAETRDKLTRVMRRIVDENPQFGEEMVLRWAHGLSVDTGKLPFVIYENQMTFGRNIIGATDTTGVQDDVMRSDMLLQMGFNVPIPRTELGGIIITFAVIKPDETISSQPHPFLSDAWGLDNFVADELALDPVPVTIRELDSDCEQAQETSVTLYTGLNALKQTYVSYGLNRHLDPETVENKTAVWQLDVPLSVTPSTILYPEDLEHYPFADQLAEVCTYTISSQAVVQTPIIFGPTPVEELEVIDDENIFGEEE